MVKDQEIDASRHYILFKDDIGRTVYGSIHPNHLNGKLRVGTLFYKLLPDDQDYLEEDYEEPGSR